MNRTFLTLVAAFALVGAFLVWQATSQSAARVLLPSDLIKHGSTSPFKRIHVGGRVAELPIEYTTEPQIKLRFSIQDPYNPNGAIPVVYEGLKPDMFQAGRDVIIDGDFEQGTLVASKLLTQCPSKYEPPKPKG